jgi:hypothetical protein
VEEEEAIDGVMVLALAALEAVEAGAMIGAKARAVVKVKIMVNIMAVAGTSIAGVACGS